MERSSGLTREGGNWQPMNAREQASEWDEEQVERERQTSQVRSCTAAREHDERKPRDGLV